MEFGRQLDSAAEFGRWRRLREHVATSLAKKKGSFDLSLLQPLDRHRRCTHWSLLPARDRAKPSPLAHRSARRGLAEPLSPRTTPVAGRTSPTGEFTIGEHAVGRRRVGKRKLRAIPCTWCMEDLREKEEGWTESTVDHACGSWTCPARFTVSRESIDLS